MSAAKQDLQLQIHAGDTLGRAQSRNQEGWGIPEEGPGALSKLDDVTSSPIRAILALFRGERLQEREEDRRAAQAEREEDRRHAADELRTAIAATRAEAVAMEQRTMTTTARLERQREEETARMRRRDEDRQAAVIRQSEIETARRQADKADANRRRDEQEQTHQAFLQESRSLTQAACTELQRSERAAREAAGEVAAEAAAEQLRQIQEMQRSTASLLAAASTRTTQDAALATMMQQMLAVQVATASRLEQEREERLLANEIRNKEQTAVEERQLEAQAREEARRLDDSKVLAELNKALTGKKRRDRERRLRIRRRAAGEAVVSPAESDESEGDEAAGPGLLQGGAAHREVEFDQDGKPIMRLYGAGTRLQGFPGFRLRYQRSSIWEFIAILQYGGITHPDMWSNMQTWCTAVTTQEGMQAAQLLRTLWQAQPNCFHWQLSLQEIQTSRGWIRQETVGSIAWELWQLVFEIVDGNSLVKEAWECIKRITYDVEDTQGDEGWVVGLRRWRAFMVLYRSSAHDGEARALIAAAAPIGETQEQAASRAWGEQWWPAAAGGRGFYRLEGTQLEITCEHTNEVLRNGWHNAATRQCDVPRDRGTQGRSPAQWSSGEGRGSSRRPRRCRRLQSAP